jgi:hypothetical protein
MTFVTRRRSGPVLRYNLVRLGWRTFAIRLKDSNTARVGWGGLSTSGGYRIGSPGTAGFYGGKGPPG